MIFHEHRRSRAVIALVALTLLTTGCSSPSSEAPPLRQTVEGANFIGACRGGLDIGTYAFKFGPATDHRGSATVEFPDSDKGTQTADYAVTYENGDQRLTVSLTPPWTGSFVRDAESFDWTVRVLGAPPIRSGLCRMWEIGTAID